MPRTSLSFCVVAVAALATVAAAAEPEPRALVEKSIAAQGGAKEVARLQTCITRLKGTIHSPNGDLAISGEVAMEKTVRHRAALDVEVGGMKITLLTVVTPDGAWVKLNDTVIELDADKAAEAREQGHAQWAVTLMPLLGNDFKLASRGEVKVNDRPAWGMIASRPGHRDVQLFFDQETSLLVKTEHRIKDEAGLEVTEEAIYSEFEDKGLRAPKKIVVRRDDKPYMEAEILGYDPQDKLDDSLFKKP